MWIKLQTQYGSEIYWSTEFKLDMVKQHFAVLLHTTGANYQQVKNISLLMCLWLSSFEELQILGFALKANCFNTNNI